MTVLTETTIKLNFLIPYNSQDENEYQEFFILQTICFCCVTRLHQVCAVVRRTVG